MTPTKKEIRTWLLKQLAMDEQLDPKGWRTNKQGQHYHIDGSGEIDAGMGGRFNGEAVSTSRESISKKLDDLGFKKGDDGRFRIPDYHGAPINVNDQIDAYKEIFDKESLENLISKKEKPHPVPNSPEAKYQAVQALIGRVAFKEQYGHEADSKKGNARNQEILKKERESELKREQDKWLEENRKKESAEQVRNLNNEPVFSDSSMKNHISDHFVEQAVLPSIESHNHIIGEPLSQREERMLRRYSGPSFKKMNKMAHEDSTNDDVVMLDEIIDKHRTTSPLILFRGTQGGHGCKSLGFNSTTTDFETARKYSGKGKGQIYEIHLPEGSPALSVKDYSHYQQEEEILLPRNVEFRTKGFRKIGDDTIEIVEAEFQ